MDTATRIDFINYIAANPLAGDIISGSGGARKIRWQSNAVSGKRGGTRVIYYYHDNDLPIYLFTVYKKSARDNITNREKTALFKIIKLIVKLHKENNDE
jgi:hypothetical protein